MRVCSEVTDWTIVTGSIADRHIQPAPLRVNPTSVHVGWSGIELQVLSPALQLAGSAASGSVCLLYPTFEHPRGLIALPSRVFGRKTNRVGTRIRFDGIFRRERRF